MFSRLKGALSGNREGGGLRNQLKDAVAERLRSVRSVATEAAPPEAPLPLRPKPAPAAAPAPAAVPVPVAKAAPIAPAPAVQPVAVAVPAPLAPAPAALAVDLEVVAAPAEAVAPAEPPRELASAPKSKKSAKAAETVEKKAEAAPEAVPEAPAAAAPVHAPKVAHPPKAAEKAASPSLAALAAAAGKSEGKAIHADMGSTDIEHYVARAKANGRDLASITGGEGMNRAADGAHYWGPVDNESSRAKAAGKLLAIDQWECISCGTCVEQTDRVFFLPADAKATPIAQDGPMDLIQDAIEACPVTCIHWLPEPEVADRGLATGLEEDSPRPE